METRQKEQTTAVLLLVATILKYLLFGFQYYPVLDDFIQYGGYLLYHNLGYVYFEIGTMATRPLASFLDPVLWGSLWNHMGIALALITLMHFSAVFLLERTLARLEIRVSPLFWIITLFLPIGAEGTYWISASSRLVVGLFFAALGLYFLVRALKEKKNGFFLLFILFHLLSYGFYEAVAIFSFLGSYLIAFYCRRETKRKPWVLVVPVFCLAAMLGYYVWGAQLGAMGSRAAGFTFSGLFAKIWDAIWQIGWIFTKGLYQSAGKGFFEGLRVLGAQGLWGAVWILLAAAVSVLIGIFCTGNAKKEKPQWGLFWCGALLFAAPLAPNILVETVWLPYRNLFLSFVGLAFMAEPLFYFIFRNQKLRGVVISLLLMVFLIANVNEYDTYRRMSEFDIQMAQNIAERLDEDVLEGRREAVVILQQPICVSQVNFYKDHVKSVFEADWSLTGAVRAVTKNMKIKKITPVPEGKENIAGEQVLVLDWDGHITQRNDTTGSEEVE